MPNTIKQDWNSWSDDYYAESYNDETVKALIEDYKIAFHSCTLKMIRKFLPDLNGRKICVPSSGDNRAVFAFAMMGADVTSCDISERQLENAEKLAIQLGLNINFIMSDTMRLDNIPDDTFDLVYTSNGVHVWINDLASMYKNISRILKSGSYYIMYEVHPFTRPFEDNMKQLIVKKPYGDRSSGVRDENHHTLYDYINAISENGLDIKRMNECFSETLNEMIEPDSGISYEDLHNWEICPYAGIPHWLILCAQKI